MNSLRVPSARELPDFTDEGLANQKTDLELREESVPIDRYEQFLWDRYDWSRFDPKEYGYRVIRLRGDPSNNRRKSIHSGKYFSLVTRSKYRFITNVHEYWYPHVEYYRDAAGRYVEPQEIKRITAHFNEGPRGNRKVVYLHRLLANVEGLEVGDHINGYSLDNRDCNLRPVSTYVNNHNLQHVRRVYRELLPGVVYWGHGWGKERAMVRGRLRVDGEQVYSEEIWPVAEQEKAWKWVAEMKLKLFGLELTANGPKTVPLPKFPPLIRRIFPVMLPAQATDDIPF